jgi:hypothetical protein
VSAVDGPGVAADRIVILPSRASGQVFSNDGTDGCGIGIRDLDDSRAHTAKVGRQRSPGQGTHNCCDCWVNLVGLAAEEPKRVLTKLSRMTLAYLLGSNTGVATVHEQSGQFRALSLGEIDCRQRCIAIPTRPARSPTCSPGQASGGFSVEASVRIHGAGAPLQGQTFYAEAPSGLGSCPVRPLREEFAYVETVLQKTVYQGCRRPDGHRFATCGQAALRVLTAPCAGHGSIS